MIKYKNTYATKGSKLAESIAEGPEQARKQYDATTLAFFKTYGDEAAKGLLALAKEYQ